MPAASNARISECCEDTSRVYASQVEEEFIQTAIDLNAAIILDGVYLISETGAFRIRSHDLFGPLPDVLVPEYADPCYTLGHVRHAVCKLAAIVHIHHELAGMKSAVPLRRTMVVPGSAAVSSTEIDALLEGYRRLRKQMIEIR